MRSRLLPILLSLHREDSGQDSIEYALLAASLLSRQPLEWAGG